MKRKWTISSVWGIVYPALLYLGIAYALQIGISIFSSLMTGIIYSNEIVGMSNEQLNDIMMDGLTSQLLFMNTLSGLIAIPIFILIMYLDILKDKQMGIYIRYREKYYITYLLIIPLAVTSMMSGNYLVSIIQSFMPDTLLKDFDEASAIIYSGSLISQVIGAAVVAPIIEELIFRGVIYKRIERISGTVVAMILSSVFFGVFHGNMVQAIYGFLIGMVLSFVYHKYKSIVAPIFLHGVANLMSVLLTAAIPKEEIEKAQDIVYTQSELLAMGCMAAVLGAVTILLLVIINAVEKPRVVSE